MNAALFEIDSYFERQKYIFKGKDAQKILRQFNQVQDLSCLLNMGRENEDEEGQKQLDALEKLLEKQKSKKLTMLDLKDFNITLSIGSIKCLEIAETDEDALKLISENPNAK